MKRGRKIQSKKVYHPHDLSLVQNNDNYHQKIWSEKVQEAKHIQEQKQIDKIFQKLIKERLFGNFLAEDSRISVEGYHNIDKISKKNINPPKLPAAKKTIPLRRQAEYSRVLTKKSKYSTIDVPERSQNVSRGSRKNSELRQKKSLQFEGRKSKKPNVPSKLIVISKIADFPNHFRLLTNNKSSMILDIKIGKQALIKYNKQMNSVSQSLLEKFLFFFNLPGSLNFRQYTNWLESIVNCSFREISFFIFQCLDNSQNGFLTISDLFLALQNFPSNRVLEKQLYQIKQLIVAATQSLKDVGLREIKATVEQFLVKNHTLKIQRLRDLLKHQNQDLIPANCIKSTVYHKTMYALEHDPNVREKNNHLESANNNKEEEIINIMKQDGLRYSDFAQIFSQKRSILFCLIMELLTGEPASTFC